MLPLRRDAQGRCLRITSLGLVHPRLRFVFYDQSDNLNPSMILWSTQVGVDVPMFAPCCKRMLMV